MSARLPRRHIPLSIRCQVAARQVRAIGIDPAQFEDVSPLSERLDFLLTALFHGEDCQLDHEPALVNRKQIRDRDGVLLRYEPDEHDPDCLIYRLKHDHLIKTVVRGDHGQFSDVVLAKRARRREKKAAKAKRKTKWQSKPWPKGRKLQSRGFTK